MKNADEPYPFSGSMLRYSGHLYVRMACDEYRFKFKYISTETTFLLKLIDVLVKSLTYI